MASNQLIKLDTLCDALYLTSASRYSDGSTIGVANTGETQGTINGTDWFIQSNILANDYIIEAIYQTEFDLTGLDHATLSALSFNQYQAEPTGCYNKGAGYVRDFTWITTTPLERGVILGQLDSFSPRAPYQTFSTAGGSDMPALIAKEQMITGRAKLAVADTSLDSSLGFLREAWNQDYNIGNLAASRKLYYTRAVFATGDFGAFTPSFYLDLPARHDLLMMAELDVSDNTQTMTMIRSYQAPEGNE